MINNKVEEIKNHIEEIMRILEIEKTESNNNTPIRVAKMYEQELFRNRNNRNLEELDSSMKVFGNVDNIKDMVIIEDISFSSICEHHWLPFQGIISVGYIPNDHIIGLSKVPRVVKHFSKKPQLQERLVKEIADYLFSILSPEFLIVEGIATHDCVMCRGIESECSTNTIYTLGETFSFGSQRNSNEFFLRRQFNYG